MKHSQKQICLKVKNIKLSDLNKSQKALLTHYAKEVSKVYNIPYSSVVHQLSLFRDVICREFLTPDVWSMSGIAYMYLFMEHDAYTFGNWNKEIISILKPKGKINPLYQFFLEEKGMEIWYKWAEGLIDLDIRKSLLSQAVPPLIQPKKEVELVSVQPVGLESVNLLERCFNLCIETPSKLDIEKPY